MLTWDKAPDRPRARRRSPGLETLLAAAAHVCHRQPSTTVGGASSVMRARRAHAWTSVSIRRRTSRRIGMLIARLATSAASAAYVASERTCASSGCSWTLVPSGEMMEQNPPQTTLSERLRPRRVLGGFSPCTVRPTAV